MNFHWKDRYWGWNSSTLSTWCEESTHWKSPWCWERLRVGEEEGRGWDGRMASLTWWTWIWINSGSWWWSGRLGVLHFMGSQRVGHSWANELNWIEIILIIIFHSFSIYGSDSKHSFWNKNFLGFVLVYMLNRRRKWQTTRVFLPRESCGQRSLVGCCLWGCTESDMTEATSHVCMYWRRKWQPTRVFLPGESLGQRSLVGCCLWGCTESDRTEAT